jgi:hypothetical protein
VNASPGAAVGQAYFDADTAEKMAKEQKQDVIMVRPFTKPDDARMIAAGVLTSEGGGDIARRGGGAPVRHSLHRRSIFDQDRSRETTDDRQLDDCKGR